MTYLLVVAVKYILTNDLMGFLFSEWIDQVAEFFNATIAKGADTKLAANWIVGDIAAFMKNEKLTINEIKFTPEELSELIASIKDGVISGKIGKAVHISLELRGGSLRPKLH